MGVPVEFKSRVLIGETPGKEMIGYWTYNLPAGTWSDDSSHSFCLVEALIEDYDLNRIGRNFVKWLKENYWTPQGQVFYVGITTKIAIERFANGVNLDCSGGRDDYSNGNRSLMRILSLLFHISNLPIDERFDITKQVSSINHAHIRSVIACFYYLEYSRLILIGKNKFYSIQGIAESGSGVS